MLQIPPWHIPPCFLEKSTKGGICSVTSWCLEKFPSKKAAEAHKKKTKKLRVTFRTSIRGIRVNCPPSPYFAEGEKILGVFLYKRPFFSIGKKVYGLIIAPLIFSKNCRKGGGQLTRIPLITFNPLQSYTF